MKKKCLWCGKFFKPARQKPSYYNKIKFCNKSCSKKYEWNKGIYKSTINNINWNHPLTEQVLLGSIMGDGCLTFANSINCRYQEKHSIREKEYLQWKCKIFGLGIKQYTKTMVETYSSCDKRLTELHKQIYPKGRKTIQESCLNKINELGLLIWFLDDGCYQYGGGGNSNLYTNGHRQLYKQKMIKNWLRNKWDINCRISQSKTKKYGKYYYIRFIIKETEKLLDVIYPPFEKYSIPMCMSRKMGYKISSNLKKINEYRKKRKAYVREYRKRRKKLGDST